ncbi:hypothetical protein P691DRAFT_789199 [Macrolepiota fuliginosa MF-IS2]|uniref:Uncharacterized protein n=1 Tax=Macrolepiota fuliginosa MF-IS2 TaxID=1400762 RepID=A0A9P6BX38_9AGAR|nr:hypothetical protein P691DRAFT_789199 [Macrolepiota fuliginosa MF-IS2]
MPFLVSFKSLVARFSWSDGQYEDSQPPSPGPSQAEAKVNPSPTAPAPPAHASSVIDNRHPESARSTIPGALLSKHLRLPANQPPLKKRRLWRQGSESQSTNERVEVTRRSWKDNEDRENGRRRRTRALERRLLRAEGARTYTTEPGTESRYERSSVTSEEDDEKINGNRNDSSIERQAQDYEDKE